MELRFPILRVNIVPITNCFNFGCNHLVLTFLLIDYFIYSTFTGKCIQFDLRLI